MPEYWYSYRAINQDDPKAELNKKIVAAYKPYFMTYVYPTLKSKYGKYVKDNNADLQRKFWEYNVSTIKELEEIENKPEEMKQFISHYYSGIKIGLNPCVVNRICWLFESEFPKLRLPKQCKEFDYGILKSDAVYSDVDFKKILRIYKKTLAEFESYFQASKYNNFRGDCVQYNYEDFANRVRAICNMECPNEDELCNIILDICYKTENSKRFAWMIAGETIIKNLLIKNGSKLTFPVNEGHEFEYGGEWFSMKTIVLQEEEPIDYPE